RVDLRHCATPHQGDQGPRVQGRRPGDGVQADRGRPGPLARRERAPPGRPGPRRRPLPPRQARRTREHRHHSRSSLKDPHPQVLTIALETLHVYLGDRLGLYRALRALPDASPGELATEAGIGERYAREWLEQQAVAGLVDVVT